MKPALIVNLLALAFGAAANGGVVVQWQVASGGNNHYYEYVAGPITWTAANTAAQASAYLGLPGHLVTANSSAESDFLFGSIFPSTATANGAWIGLTDDEMFGGHESYGQSNPAIDGWRWVTGEPVAFTAWNSFSAEPNNGLGNNSGDEDYALMFVFRGNFWNDQTASYETGYIVEYEPAAVPEPASILAWIVLAVGGVGTARRHRLAKAGHCKIVNGLIRNASQIL